MNLLASGLTAYLLRAIFGVSGTFSDPAIVGLAKIRIARSASDSRSSAGASAARRRSPGRAWVLVGDRQRSSCSRRRSASGCAASANEPDAAETLGVDVSTLSRRRPSLALRRARRPRRRAALARRRHRVRRGHERRARLDRGRRGHARAQPSRSMPRRPACCSASPTRSASACRAAACPTNSPTSRPMSSRSPRWRSAIAAARARCSRPKSPPRRRAARRAAGGGALTARPRPSRPPFTPATRRHTCRRKDAGGTPAVRERHARTLPHDPRRRHRHRRRHGDPLRAGAAGHPPRGADDDLRQHRRRHRRPRTRCASSSSPAAPIFPSRAARGARCCALRQGRRPCPRRRRPRRASSLPEPKARPVAEHASDLIIRMARENPGAITLCPVGPLTNVALALAKAPEIAPLLQARSS